MVRNEELSVWNRDVTNFNLSWIWKILKILIVLAVIGIGFIFFNPIAVVPAGYKGVLLTWGAVTDVYSDGIHIIVPIMQSVQLVETRTLKYETDADAASSDLQQIITSIALNYHVDSGKIDMIYKNLGLNFQDRIIAPAIEESVKATTARYTAEQLITKREDVKGMMDVEIKDRLSSYNIIVDTINIVNFKFSDQFNKAIESKVMAEQDALTAQRTLERVKFEAQQKIETAKGEAESIRIVNEQVLKSPQYVTWLYANKWDGKLPIVTSGMPFVQIPFNTQ